MRAKNADGPRFSFVDGPVTANREVARRPHRLGAHAQGRLPALQGAARLSPALPERLRLPGALDRGRRRALARPQLEARDRGVRARRVRPPLPRGRRQVVARADRGLDPARPVDGLGQGLLHVLGHEHRVHLALPRASSTSSGWLYIGHRSTEWCPRCGTSISAHELHGHYEERRRPVALRPLPAARPRGRVDRRLDDDAVDAARERRRSRQPGRRLRAARGRRVGRLRALPGGALHAASSREPSSSACATRGRSTRSGPARRWSTA